MTGAAVAVTAIDDGAVVGVGGYLQQNVPMALLADVAESGVRGLTVVAAPSASLGVEFLVASGCVDRVICPFVGFEEGGAPPALTRALERGSVERVLCDQGLLVAGLRASAHRVPSGLIRRTGSEVEEASPLARPVICEFTGEPLWAVRALDLDVALLHAQAVDAVGNLHYLGSPFMDLMFAQAATTVFAQTDRRGDDGAVIANVWVDQVPIIRHGSALPTASHGEYGQDHEAVAGYLERETAEQGAGYRWLLKRIPDVPTSCVSGDQL